MVVAKIAVKGLWGRGVTGARLLGRWLGGYGELSPSSNRRYHTVMRMPPVQERPSFATFLRENWNNLAFLAGFIVLAWQLAPKFLHFNAGTETRPAVVRAPAQVPMPTPEPSTAPAVPAAPVAPAMKAEVTMEPESTKEPVHGSAAVAPAGAPAKPAPTAATTRTYSIRFGAATVSGRLPVEAVQKGVRTRRDQFGLCYAEGLARNSTLQGRVGVRFVIGRDGTVSNVSRTSSDLADNGVISCVVKAFYGLSFPKPESGIVTVAYPVLFSPG
jgi:hypothetical protein